ncbi:pimeloyl-ACP methyl ester carboxylesterase [Brucella pseudogrignonensis]|uniref:Pimeloyl-ACP methyl ester carboxylesterase n=2 Tax=Brucella pseudogrignonensis TaxID=419475 RepID=A0ABU1MBA5_9HYPH|nr:pimeloyl-ACP methyl ester carboxylesterase [Brucella pseudogrignonensis]
MASDLNDLLDQLGPGPFILVAHSGGGPIIREATAARPERIAGLVLIDAPDEGCLALFDKTFLLLEKVAHAASCALARVGLLSLFYRRLMAPLPRDVRHDLGREGFTQKAMATRGAELKGLREALNKYRYQAPTLPNNPVTLISGAKADFGMSTRLRAAANTAHNLRAKLLPHGRHVLAKKSGHCVLLTEPDLIVNEIYKIIREQKYR